jgi:hypothetical protein
MERIALFVIMLCSSEKEEAKQQTSRSKQQMAQLANCICLIQLGLLFDPKDRGHTFLQNVGISSYYILQHY